MDQLQAIRGYARRNDTEYVYTPIIKKKGFLPNPVAINGIPKYADSDLDPDVIGTVAWEEWWTEQLYYCVYGYDTGGMHIPGRYYYYLNFFLMSTVGIGNHHPAFFDLDYEFFSTVEAAKADKKGIISLKARRKGLSNKVVGIIDHGFHFNKSYNAGICAGLETHAEDFYSKFQHNFSLKPPELRMNVKSTVEKTEHKYRVKENGIYIEKGTFNILDVATMFTNPGVFKGKKLEDCVFEEAGEFPLLIEGFEATKPCFMDSDLMIGTPYVYGTGGNMNKGSAAFAEMWHEPDSFNLIKFWVPANRASRHYIGGITGGPMDPSGEHIEKIPNLLKYKPYERVGMEDIEEATKSIMADRAKASKKKNKQSYYDNLQNNPLTEKEAFLKFSGNDFPTEELNEQLFKIDSDGVKYNVYRLSWKKTEDGKLRTPYEVDAQALTDEEIAEAEHLDDQNIVYVYKLPQPTQQGLDVGGLDSYDLDKSKTSKSLGAMVVYRRKNNMRFGTEMPVALVNHRPRRKEIFYETCAMVSVWYGLKYNVLCDIANPLVIKHFEELGLRSYLAERPKKFESEGSKQSHELGVRLTTFAKPQMIALLQSYFSYNADKVEFDQILNEALDYDVAQKESDWDTVDALGIALMRDADMDGGILDESEFDEEDFDLPDWVEDADGYLVMRNDTHIPGKLDNTGRDT